jgi:hypothetical protein
MGAYRFNRERGFNQRLDTIESNHTSTRHTLQDTNQALQRLDVNQDKLQEQVVQLDKNREKFEAAVLQWLNNLDARINPILQVQALTLKSVSLNQAMNQEIGIAHVRLESYTDTVLLNHVNSDILTTQEFNTVASKLQEVTELRAIHNPHQIPCAMTPHRDAQSISVIFAIPLTEPEPYTLVRLIPIKSFQDKQSIIPKIQHQYVALSKDEYHYVPLTEPEYKECLKGPCSFLSVASSPAADSCGLEQYFGHLPTPCEGIVIPEIPRDTFLPFGDLGTIFIIVSQATATISCLGRVYGGKASILLKGTGLLHVPPLCTAHIVGTPPTNSVRIRGPEATFLFQQTSPDGLLSQLTMTATKLGLQARIRSPVEISQDNSDWQEIVIGKTKKLVQQVSDKATILATNFRHTFMGKTQINMWLSGASVTIAIIIMIIGLILAVVIWLKLRIFQQSLRHELGDVVTTVRDRLSNFRQALNKQAVTPQTPPQGEKPKTLHVNPARIRGVTFHANEHDEPSVEMPLLIHNLPEGACGGPSYELKTRRDSQKD